jgi:hypothetical protein
MQWLISTRLWAVDGINEHQGLSTQDRNTMVNIMPNYKQSSLDGFILKYS